VFESRTSSPLATFQKVKQRKLVQQHCQARFTSCLISDFTSLLKQDEPQILSTFLEENNMFVF